MRGLRTYPVRLPTVRMRTGRRAVTLERWGQCREEEVHMSMMDKIKSMLKGHESQAGQGIDKSGDFVDDKTQNKYSGQVDTAQDKLKDRFGTNPDQDKPPQT